MFPLTAVLDEALVAELAEARKAFIEVPRLPLQLRVLLLHLLLFAVALQGGDYILVDLWESEGDTLRVICGRMSGLNGDVKRKKGEKQTTQS